MKNNFLRLICIGLVLMMALAVFAGCKNDGKEENTTNGNQNDETDDGNLDNLPSNLNFGGQVFKVYSWTEAKDLDWYGEFSAELVNGAVYESREYVAERLGIVFEHTTQAGHWAGRETFITNLENSINNGDTFDLVSQYTPAAAVGAMKGLYQDLNQVGYLDFDQPWWPGNIKESCSIGDKVYFCSGDLSQTGITEMGTVIVNLDMWEDLTIAESIYDVVLGYDWTLEKMMTLTLGLTGESETAADQKYALIFGGGGVADHIFYGSGMTFVTHDSDGLLQMSEDLETQKAIDLYEDIRELVTNYADVGKLDSATSIGTTFVESKALMYMSLRLLDVQTYLLDADFDYAVVPYPMYDDEQEEYYSIAGYSVSMFSVPVTAANSDMTGAVMEAMGSSGYETITPAVYEQAFRLRYMQNPQNAELLDIIHDSIIYDSGRIFADDIAMYNLFRNAFYDDYKEWTTLKATYQNGDIWRINIEKVNLKLG
ncbi:MAG: hypothetical protein IJW55_00455 [Clostridia bacterium]|nr:hypothetical protein [Clostridia bacterium]